MLSGITSYYSIGNWLEASKDFKLSGYPESEKGEQPITKFFYGHSPDNGSPFSSDDFENALRKVSRKATK